MLKSAYIIIIFVLVTLIVGSAVHSALAQEAAATDVDGKLRYTVVVYPFNDYSGRSYKWRHQGDMKHACRELMISALVESGYFTVVEYKEEYGQASGSGEQIEGMQQYQQMMSQYFPNQQGAQPQSSSNNSYDSKPPAVLKVYGTITHVQESTGGIGVGGVKLGKTTLGGSTKKGEVNISLKVIEVETGHYVSNADVEGKSSQSSLNIDNVFPVNADVDAYKNDNVGRALLDAVQKSVELMVDDLDKIQWTGNVIAARPGRITINRGAREGVGEGRVFVFGAAEELRDDNTGELLDYDFFRKGKIRVNQVKEKVSYCVIVEGSDAVKGDLVLLD